MQKMKNALIGAVAVIVLVCGAFSLLSSDLEHIEDTNGADNYDLQEIYDYNIINKDIGALNFSQSDELFNNLPTFKSKKFTGVAEVYATNMVANRFDITLYNTTVNSGNFKIVLVHNDEIVHEFKLNELEQSYTLENPKGTVALRIAGESADFKFSYDVI